MDPAKMMGFETPGDRRIPVTVRDWDAMKRAVWRNAKALESIANNAADILDRCEHAEGCPGSESDTEPCLLDRYATDEAMAVITRPRSRVAAWLSRMGRKLGLVRAVTPTTTPAAKLISRGCPDREMRMSALVILTAVRQAAPANVVPCPPDQPYFAPTREYFSEVISSLGAAQIEIDELRKALQAATERPTTPPPPAALQENT